MAIDRMRVDGLDATDAILRLLARPGFGAGPRAVLLDGIAYGGFNLVDMDRLHRRSGRPVISITRRRPDLPAIRAALRKYFPTSFRRRWACVRAHPLLPLRTADGTRYFAAVGCRAVDARRLLLRLLEHGAWPEPLRIARLLAHAEPSHRGKARAP